MSMIGTTAPGSETPSVGAIEHAEEFILREHPDPVPRDVPATSTPTGPVVRQVLEASATNVRRLRHEAGASSDDLAAVSGIGRTTLFRLEAGKTDPRLSTLVFLALGLGVPLHALIGELPEAVQASSQVSRMGVTKPNCT